MNIDKGFLALHHFLNVGFKLVDFDTLFADHDSGSRGMNIDLGLVGHAFDFHARDASVIQALLDEVAQLQVFVQERGVVMTREPTRIPAFDYPEPQSAGM